MIIIKKKAMAKKKLPRKLKKAMDKVWLTKRQLTNRLHSIENAPFKGCYLAGWIYVSKEEEIQWCRQMLETPYPITKWTRKAERMIFNKK